MKKLKSWFANLSTMIRPCWKYGKFYCIFMILWECMYAPISTMIEVYLIEISLNQLSDGYSFSTIFMTILFFLALNIIMSVTAEALYYFYFNPKREKIEAEINIEVFNHFHKTDYQYFDNPEFYDLYTASYSQYASKSSEAFRNLINILSLIFTVGTLVGYIMSSTFYIIIITFVSVIIKVYLGRFINRINSKYDDEKAPISRMSSYLQSTLCSRENSMDVKSTNMFETLIRKYKKTIDESVIVQKKYRKKQYFLSFIESFAIYGSSSLIRIIVCSLILIGKVGVGSFVSLINASNSLAWKVQVIAKYYTNLDRSCVCGKKINEFLSFSSTIENKEKELIVKKDMFEVKLENVSFGYHNSDFKLSNINMIIPKGKKIAIVGENGGGKTTLTKLLLRLYDPDQGTILIDGTPLNEINLDDYRKNIGIAFQEFPIYSLSLRDNLSAYSNVDDDIMKNIFGKLNLDSVLEKNNASLDTPLTRKFDANGIMLSGGEKQKIGVARLLTKDFGLLIFDEPTAALDPIAEENLKQIIFSQANKTTTILISHRLSNVVDADCIYVFKNGEIIEHGTHNELMAKSGMYYNMFELQAKNYREITT